MWPILLIALVGEPDTSVPEPTTPLSARDLAALAADTSPSVRAALARADGRAVATREIDQRFWPRVTASARYTRMSYNEPTVIAPPGVPLAVEIPGALEDQVAIGIGVALPLSDWLLRWDEAQAAGREAEAAERALAEAARNQSAAEALALWYQWQRARLGVEVGRAAVADAEAHLAAALVLQRAEVAAAGDVRLAEARLAEARLGLERARHGQALAERSLSTVTHQALDPARLPVTTEAIWPAPDEPRAALIERALGARPEALALAHGEAALQRRSDLAAIDRLPRLDLVANAQVANPSPRGLQNEDEFVGLWDASAVLSWRLDGLWEAETAADRIAAERRGLAADREALADGIAFEIDLALRSIADADAAARASAAMLVAAEEAHRVRTKAYAAGRASSLDLSEAERQLTQARLAGVDATIDRRLGELRLAHALGVRVDLAPR
ncbi:MAG: TolC family protein [Deltaproteobacteria bacterium]|nr:TolC family protein [Deltaproteobacteria bacterium]